jgi:hypothetical protein
MALEEGPVFFLKRFLAVMLRAAARGIEAWFEAPFQGFGIIMGRFPKSIAMPVRTRRRREWRRIRRKPRREVGDGKAPKGRASRSPGATPREMYAQCREAPKGRPKVGGGEGDAFDVGAGFLGRPFRASVFWGVAYPGRCPGLGLRRAFGAKKRRASEAEAPKGASQAEPGQRPGKRMRNVE